MSRNRYITNSRAGIEGSIVRGNVIYTTLDGAVGLGGAGQGLHEESTTQRYDVGTRLVTGDGRVFRYAYIGSATCNTKSGVFCWDAQYLGWTAVNASQAIGDTQISLANQTAAEDVLRGGCISVAESDDSTRRHRLITGNTAASGSTMIIYLDDPLDVAVTDASSVVEVLYSPYRNCHWSSNSFASVVGVPAVDSTVGNYIWIQTWGVLTLSTTAGTANPGIDTGERQMVFDSYGQLLAYADGSSSDRQVIGFIVQKDNAGSVGCPFIMLQISP